MADLTFIYDGTLEEADACIDRYEAQLRSAPCDAAALRGHVMQPPDGYQQAWELVVVLEDGFRYDHTLLALAKVNERRTRVAVLPFPTTQYQSFEQMRRLVPLSSSIEVYGVRTSDGAEIVATASDTRSPELVQYFEQLRESYEFERSSLTVAPIRPQKLIVSLTTVHRAESHAPESMTSDTREGFSPEGPRVQRPSRESLKVPQIKSQAYRRWRSTWQSIREMVEKKSPSTQKVIEFLHTHQPDLAASPETIEKIIKAGSWEYLDE